MVACRRRLARCACAPPIVLGVVLCHNFWQLPRTGCASKLAEVHEGGGSGRQPDVPAVPRKPLGVERASPLYGLVRGHTSADQVQMEAQEAPHGEQKRCMSRKTPLGDDGNCCKREGPAAKLTQQLCGHCC